MKIRWFWWWSGGLLLVSLAVALTVYLARPVPKPTPGLAVSTTLGGDDHAGYQRADRPRPFQFPADHGPHPEFRNEWWYVTGNLADANGRSFGYQITLFRIALAPTPPEMDSAWRTNQVYMGHFALTDIAGQEHHAFERFSRAALGLAGARAAPFRVWMEDWELAGPGPESESESDADDIFPLQVRACEGGIAVDLTLTAAKPRVLQGDRGLHQRSTEPGNASYYYSYTRLPTQGVIRIGQQQFKVSGTSWLDREWSTSALGPDQSGWDWFALQLDDGQDLMFYRLRHADGSMDAFSKGVLVAADGQARLLRWNDVELQPLDHWTSPHTGDRYPIRWRLRVPAEALDLTVTAKLADQEMRLTMRYWEGAVSVAGRDGDRVVDGRGYLEMTRYEPVAAAR